MGKQVKQSEERKQEKPYARVELKRDSKKEMESIHNQQKKLSLSKLNELRSEPWYTKFPMFAEGRITLSNFPQKVDPLDDSELSKEIENIFYSLWRYYIFESADYNGTNTLAYLIDAVSKKDESLQILCAIASKLQFYDTMYSFTKTLLSRNTTVSSSLIRANSCFESAIDQYNRDARIEIEKDENYWYNK